MNNDNVSIPKTHFFNFFPLNPQTTVEKNPDEILKLFANLLENLPTLSSEEEIKGYMGNFQDLKENHPLNFKQRLKLASFFNEIDRKNEGLISLGNLPNVYTIENGIEIHFSSHTTSVFINKKLSSQFNLEKLEKKLKKIKNYLQNQKLEIIYISNQLPPLEFLKQFGEYFLYFNLEMEESYPNEILEHLFYLLPNLQFLSLTSESLEKLPSILHLKKLQNLTLNLNQLNELEELPSGLTTFTLYNKALKEIKAFPGSLESLSLSCEKIERLPAFPPLLASLILINSNTLKKIPFFNENLKSLETCRALIHLLPSFPESLDNIHFTDTAEFTLEDKLKIFDLSLQHKPSTAIGFLEFIFIKDANSPLPNQLSLEEKKIVIPHLCEALTIPQIISYKHQISKYLHDNEFFAFIWKVWNWETNIFFENFDVNQFSSSLYENFITKSKNLLNLIKVPPGESYEDVILHLLIFKKLNLEKLTESLKTKSSTIEEVIEYEKIDLFTTLPKLFNLINFTDPKDPFYVDPTCIKNREDSISLIEVREGLSKLLDHIAYQKAFEGVPIDPQHRIQYYERLEKILKEFCVKGGPYLLHKNNADMVRTASAELIKIGISGHYCGTRWEIDGIQANRALKGDWNLKPEGESLELHFENMLYLYFMEIAQFLTLKKTKTYGFSNQIHIYNHIGKLMHEKRGIPFREGTFQFDDPFKPFNEESEKNILSAIDQALSPIAITRAMWIRCSNIIQEEIKKLKDSSSEPTSYFGNFIELMRSFAEKPCQQEIKEIEELLPQIALIKGVDFLKKKLTFLKEKENSLLIKKNKAQIKQDEKEKNHFLKRKEYLNKNLVENALKRQKNNEGHPLLKDNPTSDSLTRSETNSELMILETTKEHKIQSSLKKLDKKLEKLKKEIDYYESLDTNKESNEDKIVSLGLESARITIIIEKQKVLDRYLKEENYFTFDDETFEMEISPLGTFLVMRHLGYFI